MSEAGKSSPWVWISLVLIIALFVAFVLFLDQKIVKNSRQQAAPSPQQEISSKPIFDFYTVLPKRQVDIPETSVETPDVPNASQSVSASKGKLMLQAGSFQKLVDADRRKAELALLGLEATIKQAQVNGQTYHRVELGPFEDDGFYSQVQRRLIENDIAFMPRSAE